MDKVIVHMKPSIQNLYEELQSRLKQLQTDGNPLIQKQKSLSLSKEMLLNLKKMVISSSFHGEQQEIDFFKRIKPLFLQELIYYAESYRLEIQAPSSSEQDRKIFFQKEMDWINREFSRHPDFYHYYKSGATALDPLLFRLGQPTDTVPFLPLPLDIDQNFSTGYDYLAAHLLALERLSLDINDALVLKWQKSKAALTELTYALYAAGAFSQPDIKKIALGVSSAFGMDLGNFYKIYEEMRLRKKDRTPLLNELKRKLDEQMDRDDVK